MSAAFRKNDISSQNVDNSFNNYESFLNNNENCFNTNTYNTSTYNTTTVNYTAVDDRSEVLAWLSPVEPRLRHRDIAARRVGCIGAWLPETEEFKRWNKGGREDGSYHATLFCDGDPGVGKSYIT